MPDLWHRQNQKQNLQGNCCICLEQQYLPSTLRSPLAACPMEAWDCYAYVSGIRFSVLKNSQKFAILSTLLMEYPPFFPANSPLALYECFRSGVAWNSRTSLLDDFDNLPPKNHVCLNFLIWASDLTWNNRICMSQLFLPSKNVSA